jgi:fused signal recognition particle receptor
MALFGRFVDKLRDVASRFGRGISDLFAGRPVDESFYEALEERLILGDVGVETADSLLGELREAARRIRPKDASELRGAFADLIVGRLESLPAMGAPLRTDGRPSVVLLVGVNGSGKTTTAGKLAERFRREGTGVVLAAADTYRAAAVEQLKAWGERSRVRVVAQGAGSDAAAVVFDAIQAARSGGAGLVVVDTAGRLHTKHNLMEELCKVYRVACREAGEEQVESLLVLDAVVGQNGFRQAQAFGEAFRLDGVILTKFDNTAKGGIVLAIADRLKLPVRYVGLGEGIDDLDRFDGRAFTAGLLDMPPSVEPHA